MTVLAAVIALLSLVGSACQSSAPQGPGGKPPAGTGEPGAGPTTEGGTGTSFPTTPPSPSPVSAADISITPEDGARFARPDLGITVTASGGRLTDVTVEGGNEPVEGSMNAQETEWRSEWALNTSMRYTVTATAVDDAGLSITETSAFKTLTPGESFRTIIFQGYRKTYGVGMPIILMFDRDIEEKEAVERSLELRTSRPVVGAWYWNGDQTLMFRPRGYWPAHTIVHFTGHLDGVKGGPGFFGVHTLTQDFVIGRSLIAVASTRTHRMQVYLDKKQIGDWPISTGKPEHETPNGTYLSITKHNPERMVGEDYDIKVPFSVRFTWSGSFLHAAPWSINEQGAVNVSHGCVNMAPDDAERYYKLSVPGDPVTILGSPKAGEWDDGWTIWFVGWKQILEGSSLHMAVKANRDGSEFVKPGTLPTVELKVPLQGSRPGNYLASPQ